MFRLTPLFAALLLTACAVDLPPADPVLPAASQWQEPVPQAPALADARDWWRAWQDPALASLIEAALAGNPALDVAAARIREARARAYSARSYLWPTVNGSAGATRAQNTLQDAPLGNSLQAGLDASWEIDLWGGIRAAEQSLRADLAAQLYAERDARLSLAAETANAYVALRAYQKMAAIMQADLVSRERSARLTRDKQSAGLASPVDVALLEASLAEGQAQLAELQEGIALAYKALVALTGKDETALRAQLATGSLPAPVGFALDTLPARLVEQRFDVRIAAEQVKGAAAAVGVAKVARLPSLSLFGAIQIGEQRSQGVEISGSSWSFGPTLKLPLFNAGRLQADQDAAEARYDAAQGAYRQTVIQAVRDVEEAMVRLNAADRRLEATRRAVAGYQQQLDASDAMQRVGSASLLDVEISRRFWLGAQTRAIAQERERLAYWIALYKAAGGWNTADLTPADYRGESPASRAAAGPGDS
ncbi:efflux transporter outer membrane subunit [Chitinilyticum litopenaei]|uniref:efflux transporter outer membrane subunit n=1 Tax=Chitinilyticum litopenaei TaxID=1121276 RepID=UPI0003F5B28C|nr:efflux transporter outer membrane subunit [Chitinilyticum litopenaei]